MSDYDELNNSSEPNQSLGNNSTNDPAQNNNVENGNTTNSVNNFQGSNVNEMSEEKIPVDFITAEDNVSKTTQNASAIQDNTNSVIEEIEVKRTKNKKFKLGMFAAVAAVLILIVALSSNTIKNALSRSSKSPEDYFRSVLNSEVKELATQFEKNIAANSKATEVAYDVNFNLTLGEYAKQLLTYSDFTVDSFDAKINYKANQSQFQTNAMIGLNGTDLISMLIFTDIAQDTLIMQVPEFSSAFFSIPLSYADTLSTYDTDVFNQLTSLGKTFDAKTINSLFVDYSDTILKAIDNVELEKEAKVSVNGTSATYNKLTATINDKNLIDICIAILEKASEDEAITSLIELITSTSGETYSSDDIKALVDELKSSRELASLENLFSFSIYVDNDELKGFEVLSSDNSFSIALTTVDSKNNGKFEFTVIADSVKVASMTGNWKEDNSAYSGNIDISVTTTGYEETTTTVNLVFDDFKYADKDKNTLNGTFSISSEALSGGTVTGSLNGSGNTQNITLAVSFLTTEIGTLSIDVTKKEFDGITIPSTDVEIYDVETEMEEYVATGDAYSFMDELSNKIGIDLFSLLGGNSW